MVAQKPGLFLRDWIFINCCNKNEIKTFLQTVIKAQLYSI